MSIPGGRCDPSKSAGIVTVTLRVPDPTSPYSTLWQTMTAVGLQEHTYSGVGVLLDLCISGGLVTEKHGTVERYRHDQPVEMLGCE
jgi:hypothetical protein